MRKWFAKLIYKEVFITEEDLKIRNIGITNELRELKKENKILKDDFERFKILAVGGEFLESFNDSKGELFYVFRRREEANTRITIQFVSIINGKDLVAGNYLYTFFSDTKIKLDDCQNESYKDRGHGSVFMKYFLEDIMEFGVKKVEGDLRYEDGTEDSKNRREHFYKKFGFEVSWDDKDRTTGKINLTIDK